MAKTVSISGLSEILGDTLGIAGNLADNVRKKYVILSCEEIKEVFKSRSEGKKANSILDDCVGKFHAPWAP